MVTYVVSGQKVWVLRETVDGFDVVGHFRLHPSMTLTLPQEGPQDRLSAPE